MNNGKYDTPEYKEKIAKSNDRRFGEVKVHQKECVKCGTIYPYNGREKTKAFKESKFCSRSCANSRQDWWNENATNYRTIAFQTWKKECAICGFNKVVEVHHLDENHNNNDPDNLIPLCPNHHQMLHSKWKEEVEALIHGAVAQ